jgi:hypothetical protein
MQTPDDRDDDVWTMLARQASGSAALLAAIGKIARGAIVTRSSLRSHLRTI